jgi:hypothetical protein
MEVSTALNKKAEKVQYTSDEMQCLLKDNSVVKGKEKIVLKDFLRRIIQSYKCKTEL